MPYSLTTAWEEQLREMDAQDREGHFKMRNKIYPNGLFTLTSNPLFELYSLHRKLKAIYQMLRQQQFVKQDTIYYNDRTKVVFFDTAWGLHQMCTLHDQQVRIIE